MTEGWKDDSRNEGGTRNGKGENGSLGRLGSVGKKTTLPTLKAGRDIAREKVK